MAIPDFGKPVPIVPPFIGNFFEKVGEGLRSLRNMVITQEPLVETAAEFISDQCLLDSQFVAMIQRLVEIGDSRYSDIKAAKELLSYVDSATQIRSRTAEYFDRYLVERSPVLGIVKKLGERQAIGVMIDTYKEWVPIFFGAELIARYNWKFSDPRRG